MLGFRQVSASVGSLPCFVLRARSPCPFRFARVVQPRGWPSLQSRVEVAVPFRAALRSLAIRLRTDSDPQAACLLPRQTECLGITSRSFSSCLSTAFRVRASRFASSVLTGTLPPLDDLQPLAVPVPLFSLSYLVSLTGDGLSSVSLSARRPVLFLPRSFPSASTVLTYFLQLKSMSAHLLRLVFRPCLQPTLLFLRRF